MYENPSEFEALRRDGEDDWTYFDRVFNSSPKSVPSFDGYLELLELFIERTDDCRIEGRIEDNLGRSVKNQFLAGSEQGKAYPVRTIADIEERLAAYEAVGLSTPTLEELVEIIVEHVFDSRTGRATAWQQLAGLLSEVPDTGSDDLEAAVESVARLRASLTLTDRGTSDSSLEAVVDRYLSCTEPPLDDPPGSAADCIEAADEMPFDRRRKVDLYVTATHLDPDRSEEFVRYLFYDARSRIESYRHGNDDLSRGGLQIAREQLEAVQNCPEPTSEGPGWEHWIESYADLAEAILHSGGPFISDRENAPDQGYVGAAAKYLSAATKVEPVSQKRAIKYRGKAYRHAALDADDPEVAVELHQVAIDRLFERLGEVDDEIATVVQESLRYQKYYQARAEQLAAWERGDYESVLEKTGDCEELAESVPQAHIGVERAVQTGQMAQARLEEVAGNLERARQLYSFVEHPQRRIETRLALCDLKLAYERGNEAEAESIFEETFEDAPVLGAAVDLLCNDTVPGISADTGVRAELAGIDEGAARALTRSLTLVRESGLPRALRSEVESLFYQL